VFVQDVMKAASTEKDLDLGMLLVQATLRRLNEGSQQSTITVQRRVTAFSNLVALTPDIVGRVLATRITGQELEQEGGLSGRDVEGMMCLTPLLRAAACTLPEAGAEMARTANEFPFWKQVEGGLPGFPASVFERTPSASANFNNFVGGCRSTMTTARNVTVSALRVVFRATKNNEMEKKQVFQWLAQIARSK
jgi:hypothetical protein